ncbi:MAG: 3-deoxy-D-manno-octulosonic acid transferase, partial [Nitrospinota bacterium]
AGAGAGEEVGLVILDTLGELASAYEVADVAFVGGSLIPHGGQNLLEPAGWGVPALFGPHMGNFREAVEWILRAGGGLQISRKEGLSEALASLLGDSSRAREMGGRAAAVVRAHRGALERSLALVEAWLGPSGAGGGTS